MKLKLGAALALLLAALGLGVAFMNGCFSQRPDAPKAGAHPWATRKDVPGVENFGEVLAGRIYRGAQPTSEGYESLKKLGVRTVISLRDWHDETKDVVASGLESVRIPLQADVRGSKPPSAEEVAKFLSVVLDPQKQPVYFHCAHGKDRTGTMCAVLRMEVFGWTNDEAWDEMQSFGFNYVWENLQKFVQSYKPLGRWRSAPVAVEAAPVASR
jgi:tyrosine-protein phosphatase SIW14